MVTACVQNTKPFAIDKTVDARGLDCPLPILRTKVALSEMQRGEILAVHTTDPHATIDFQAFCARTGHRLLEQTESGGEVRFLLQHDGNPGH